MTTTGYYEQSYPPSLWGGDGGGGESHLAIGDLAIAPGDSDVAHSTTLTSRRDHSGVHGVVTITDGAALDGHLSMTLKEFNPGIDTEAEWTVDGSDLVGTYPHGEVGESFDMWIGEDEVSTNHWSADESAPEGSYDVHTAIVSGTGAEIVADDWTLTIGAEDDPANTEPGQPAPPERTS